MMNIFSFLALSLALLWLLVKKRKSDSTTQETEIGNNEQAHFVDVRPVEGNFEWKTTDELPYRPWSDGPYFITMGLKRMQPETWTEIDNTYLKKLRYKKCLFENHRDECLQTVLGSWEPAYEALLLLAEYLCRRYPMIYRKTKAGILNLVSDDEWNILRDAETWKTRHPLEIMAYLSTEDWFIMQPGESGRYHLRAGAVCFPAGWRVKERIGKSLWGIHAERVPSYKEKLAKSMDRFFAKMPVDGPVQRFNYAIDKSPELWHIESHHHLEPDPNLRIEDLYLRVERQVLRRLPVSKAMIFSIRTYVTPLVKVTQNLEIAHALRTNIQTYSPEVASYKNRQVWNDLVMAHLDEMLKDYESKVAE